MKQRKAVMFYENTQSRTTFVRPIRLNRFVNVMSRHSNKSAYCLEHLDSFAD